MNCFVSRKKYRRVVFDGHPKVKKMWGDAFWTAGYFISTEGENMSEKVILEYVKNQGTQDQYKQFCLKDL